MVSGSANSLERRTRALHTSVVGRPFQRFGLCTSCGRLADADGRPLWITGRRRTTLICLECFDLGPAPVRRAA
jgi:hypothetical protein